MKKHILSRRVGASTDEPLRILEVVGNAYMGGMETVVHGLVGQLLAGGAAVTCVCPYESPFTSGLRALGCEVFITPIADDPPWRSIQLTLEVARLTACDLIHAHMPKAHILAGLAGCLGHLPAVATVHGMNVTSHELGICRTTGSHLITVCQEAYCQALAMGVPPERVALIPNGVDLERFRPAPRDGAFRAALGVPPEAPLVGFVGRLEHEKGPDHFVRAMAHALLSRPDLHAVMVGEGGLGDHLAGLSAQLGLGERLHMTGKLTVDAGLYNELDLLVQTSRSEGMPLVLLEAMACGVPAIAIAVGGVAEVIENEATGIIMGPGDWEGVGWKVARTLGQPQRLREMGLAARRRAEQRFDMRESTRRTSDLFRQLSRAAATLPLEKAQLS